MKYGNIKLLESIKENTLLVNNDKTIYIYKCVNIMLSITVLS